jgi:hypothetical protein
MLAGDLNPTVIASQTMTQRLLLLHPITHVLYDFSASRCCEIQPHAEHEYFHSWIPTLQFSSPKTVELRLPKPQPPTSPLNTTFFQSSCNADFTLYLGYSLWHHDTWCSWPSLLLDRKQNIIIFQPIGQRTAVQWHDDTVTSTITLKDLPAPSLQDRHADCVDALSKHFHTQKQVPLIFDDVSVPSILAIVLWRQAFGPKNTSIYVPDSTPPKKLLLANLGAKMLLKAPVDGLKTSHLLRDFDHQFFWDILVSANKKTNVVPKDLFPDLYP